MGIEHVLKQSSVAADVIATEWPASDRLSRRSVQALIRVAIPVTPNPSLNLTRYGKRRKPGLQHMVHHRSPGLRRSPPRAG